MDDETLRVVTAHNALWARGDLEALYALYHPDMVFADHYAGQKYRGDALRSHVRNIIERSQLDSLHYTDRVRVDGNTATQRYTETIRSVTDELLLSVSACDVVTVTAGLIIAIDEYAIPEAAIPRESAAPRVRGRAASIGKTGLSARAIGYLLSDLDRWMQTQRPFLNPALSLQDMALATGYTRNQISFALNQFKGVSFFDYVNRVRIRHLIHEVAYPSSGGAVAWAEQAGFRSVSTFYSAFRSATGLSPAAWLLRHKSVDSVG